MRATFDERDHATTEGYATYGQRRRRWRCRFSRHIVPVRPPYPPDGHSPSNYWTCPRCLVAMHFYVVGQHRFGGMNASRVQEGK